MFSAQRIRLLFGKLFFSTWTCPDKDMKVQKKITKKNQINDGTHVCVRN